MNAPGKPFIPARESFAHVVHVTWTPIHVISPSVHVTWIVVHVTWTVVHLDWRPVQVCSPLRHCQWLNDDLNPPESNVETFTFNLTSPSAPVVNAPARPWALVGVLASGNLEVLVEPSPDPAVCRVDVETSAHGFGEVWTAVVAEFFDQHGDALGGRRFTVHDSGATPAVVALRLEQAWRESLQP